MPQRTITGPILDTAGIGIVSGSLRVTPIEPTGTSGDGFVVNARTYPITHGAVQATVIVPGAYRFDILADSGAILRTFSANLSDSSLADISIKEVWESRVDPIDLPPATLREGDSLLRLAPGAGADGDALLKAGSRLEWGRPSGMGNMLSSVYDPNGTASDAFDRANHSGTQLISTVSGLQAALDQRALTEHTHAGSDIASGTIAPQRLGSGTPTAGTVLRGDGVWAAPIVAPPHAKIYYQKDQNVVGGDLTANIWNTWLFNTIAYDHLGGLSVNAETGVVTLPAGAYYITVRCAVHTSTNPFRQKTRVVKSDLTLLTAGYSLSHLDVSGAVNFIPITVESAYISSPTSVDLLAQTWASATFTSWGMGGQVNVTGAPEHYAEMIIVRAPSV